MGRSFFREQRSFVRLSVQLALSFVHMHSNFSKKNPPLSEKAKIALGRLICLKKQPFQREVRSIHLPSAAHQMKRPSIGNRTFLWFQSTVKHRNKSREIALQTHEKGYHFASLSRALLVLPDYCRHLLTLPSGGQLLVS